MNDTTTNDRRWTIGDALVTAVVESETHGIPPQLFFPDATADDIRACAWLDGYARSDGTIGLAVQAFLVEMPSFVVLVDPCVGNHKTRSLPFWHQQEWPFMERLAATGVSPDDIDLVVHTHLHADHVGCGTRLVDGRWEPTFANARYVYVDEELEYWRATEQRTAEDVYLDSVAPVVERGLADVVRSDTDLGHGLQLVPTAGHTPGHASLEITSRGDTLLITGDLLHHPAQFSRPEWAEIGDYDATAARTTRRAFIDEHATRGTLLAGTHFALHPVGRARVVGNGWRFDPQP
ncbi:MAG: hypothetical protein QOI55_967 [Actinomycetota bacterium]|nr:hypothetical protein [Actinomycetota bacterium]